MSKGNTKFLNFLKSFLKEGFNKGFFTSMIIFFILLGIVFLSHFDLKGFYKNINKMSVLPVSEIKKTPLVIDKIQKKKQQILLQIEQEKINLKCDYFSKLDEHEMSKVKADKNLNAKLGEVFDLCSKLEMNKQRLLIKNGF